MDDGVGLAFADRRMLCSTFLNSLVSFERRSISSFPSHNPDRTLIFYCYRRNHLKSISLQLQCYTIYQNSRLTLQTIHYTIPRQGHPTITFHDAFFIENIIYHLYTNDIRIPNSLSNIVNAVSFTFNISKKSRFWPLIRYLSSNDKDCFTVCNISI